MLGKSESNITLNTNNYSDIDDMSSDSMSLPSHRFIADDKYNQKYDAKKNNLHLIHDIDIKISNNDDVSD